MGILWRRGVEGLAADEGAAEGFGVAVGEAAAGGDAEGEAGDAEVAGGEVLGDHAGGGVAFDIGVEGDEDFGDLVLIEALVEGGEDGAGDGFLLEGGDFALEAEVVSGKAAGLFEDLDVGGGFDDAEEAGITAWVGADAAGVLAALGEVAAAGADGDFGIGLFEGGAEFAEEIVITEEEAVGHAFGAAPPDSGEPGEDADEIAQGLGHGSESHAGDVHALGDGAHFFGHGVLAELEGAVDGGEDEVFEEFGIVGIDDFGVDFDGFEGAVAGGFGGDHAAAGAEFDFAFGEFGLEFLHFGLHGLRLFDHFHHVGHGGLLGGGLRLNFGDVAVKDFEDHADGFIMQPGLGIQACGLGVEGFGGAVGGGVAGLDGLMGPADGFGEGAVGEADGVAEEFVEEAAELGAFELADLVDFGGEFGVEADFEGGGGEEDGPAVAEEAAENGVEEGEAVDDVGPFLAEFVEGEEGRRGCGEVGGIGRIGRISRIGRSGRIGLIGRRGRRGGWGWRGWGRERGGVRRGQVFFFSGSGRPVLRSWSCWRTSSMVT